MVDTGDAGLILELGRSPGEGNGNPFQYSCLGNPMDKGACPWGQKRVIQDLATKPQHLFYICFLQIFKNSNKLVFGCYANVIKKKDTYYKLDCD